MVIKEKYYQIIRIFFDRNIMFLGNLSLTSNFLGFANSEKEDDIAIDMSEVAA